MISISHLPFDSSPSGSDGTNVNANASRSHTSNIFGDCGDEAFYKFFDLYELHNSSSTTSTIEVEEQHPNSNANVYWAAMPPLPLLWSIPNSLAFNANASD